MREAISSCSWVRIERAAAAADMACAYRIRGEFENVTSRRERRTARSDVRERFLDAQLLLLEGLKDRIIGGRSAQFVAEPGFQPFMLGLKGGDVRGFHRAFSWSA